MLHSLTHSFIHSSIHPSIHPSIHSFIHSFIHTYICASIHPSIRFVLYQHLVVPGDLLLPLSHKKILVSAQNINTWHPAFHRFRAFGLITTFVRAQPCSFINFSIVLLLVKQKIYWDYGYEIKSHLPLFMWWNRFVSPLLPASLTRNEYPS